MNHQALSSSIWWVGDLLRRGYKQSVYGRVILPITVLRRLDCILEPTKEVVLAAFEDKTKAGLIRPAPHPKSRTVVFFDTSPLDLVKLLGDRDHIRQNLYQACCDDDV